MACHLRDFEDKILLHQFLKSESTNGLSIYLSIPVYVVNSDKQERSRIVQFDSSVLGLYIKVYIYVLANFLEFLPFI